MQEHDSSESNNHDDQPHIDSEQNDQNSTDSEQEKQTQDASQEQPSVPPTGASTESAAESSSTSASTESTAESSSTSAPRPTWVSGSTESGRGTSANYQAAPERGGCLTAWLVLLGIGSALVVLSSFVDFSRSAILGVLLLVGGILAFVGVVGTWQLKRWGYYLIMALYGLNVIFSLFSLLSGSGSATSVGTIIGGLVGMIILYLLVRGRWEAFA
ncbi:MAG TPA: DUF2127 domain-containing protein [Ktedonobacteraceae bacterium]|jgi:cobalamin biosynthesis Mg chelatase CobN